MLLKSLVILAKKPFGGSGGVALALAAAIVFNFGSLADSVLVITISTVYLQPLLGLVWAFCAGWAWHRAGLLGIDSSR